MKKYPFTDFQSIQSAVAEIEAADPSIRSAIMEAWNTRTKPPGSLGRLEDIAAWVGASQGKASPANEFLALRLFAGAHGIAEAGVSMCPVEVNQQMVQNFHNGGAAINALCRSNSIQFHFLDVGVDRPTRNFLNAPAMDESETVEAFSAGWDSVPAFADLFAVGEMGIANTTPAAAIISSITEIPVETITGRGAGLTDELYDKKVATLKQVLENRKGDLTDPLSILASIGGREIAAMTGAILSATAKNIPVVLDGVIAGAAAAIAFELQPNAISKCIAGHCSAEPAHRAVLGHYKMQPILDLGMRLGEGTGSAVAMGVIRNAVDAFHHMATFEQAGVVL